MQRVSVTNLEKFRRYMASVSSFDTEEALIESLRGIFKGNDKTFFGRAYHKLIEGKYQFIGDENIRVTDDKKEFIFPINQALPALNFHGKHRLLVHEMSVSKVYETNYFPIQVTGRIDGIEALYVRDAKTKFRAVDMFEYTKSCQWKFYLDMLGLDTFFYDVFEIKGFDKLPAQMPYKVDVEVIPHEEIKCQRYEEMEMDVLSQLNSFLDYIHNRNFLSYLKPAQLEEETFIF